MRREWGPGGTSNKNPNLENGAMGAKLNYRYAESLEIEANFITCIKWLEIRDRVAKDAHICGNMRDDGP